MTMPKKIKIACPHCKNKIILSLEIESSVLGNNDQEKELDFTRGSMPDYSIKTDMSFCDKIENITFKDSVFCFTGHFSYASRDQLAKVVEKLGGTVVDKVCSGHRLVTEYDSSIKQSPSKDLSYLIVGEIASRGWSYGNYGNKIAAVLNLRQNGHIIYIVDEKNFLRFIQDEVNEFNKKIQTE
jgi:hypothetical protein